MTLAETSTIQAINLAEFLNGDEAEQQRIAAEVDHICRTLGFLIVKQHGVDQRLIDNAWQAARDFFDLPTDEKMASQPPYPGCPRGYFPIASETLAKSLGVDTPPDVKESISVGPLRAPQRAIGTDDLEFHYGENRWPQKPDGLRDAFTAYMESMEILGNNLLRLFAAALSLPQNYFVEFHGDPMCALRCLNYPAVDEPLLENQRGAGEHADYGSITMWKSDPDVVGLEVRLPGGEWIPAPLVRDGFIVNIGDMMARWTNDRWVSTLHRVISPGSEGGGQRRRQSMAYFYNTDFDAEISCIPTCLEDGETAKYAPVRGGDYLEQRFSSALE